ncbi:MAG TPA: PQQ-dependent dehydrogenase, methanol/ethanol family [Vicinamibacterales bacterium]|nr:PQQ-dependent dehydrogenase, methanol/ethanol family [Vicinamibacterales bacterium]
MLGISVSIAALSAQEIATKDLMDGLANPSRWLTYSGDYTGQRFSPLSEITASNVENLAAQWTFQTGVVNAKFEATPLVIDGILYITGGAARATAGIVQHAWAVDGRTAKQLWHYQRTLPDGLKVCCGLVNRGFAVYRDRLFLVTLDAHFVALEMKTGKVIFDVEMAAIKNGFAGTGAPLIVVRAAGTPGGDKPKVIVGIAGGEYANRGFIDAYDPMTGDRLWRFHTIPEPGEPGSETWQGDIWQRGGAPTWLTGTYDPALNLLYWGTGNPNPDWNSEVRPGDNLFADSLLALDPDSGKLKWFFQFTPHDTHDWDANEVPVLADLTISGRPRKVVMMANRNGFFYVLDRETGAFILGKPFVNTSWAKELTQDGKPKVIPGHDPTEEGTVTCPDWYGGTNFMSPSFDRTRNLFFVTARETCAKFMSRPATITSVLGDRTMGGTVTPHGDPPRGGALRAIDAITGEKKWEIRYADAGWAGVLATAGGIVFSGDNQGLFFAADSKTGQKLFQYQTGAEIFGPPTTYAIDGRQFVIIPSGATLTAFALPKRPTT